MRLFVKLFIILSVAAGMAHAISIGIDSNQTGMIQISTNSVIPTQIFTNDPAATRTYIVNTSTNPIWIVGYSTTSAVSISSAAVVNTSTTSASGSFFLPGETSSASATNQPIYFSPDGPTDPFRGPLWAVSGGTGGAFIERFRAH